MESGKRFPTHFESRVYAALEEIPHGRVTTYRALADRLRCRSAQAVGQALKRNPSAPKVPCHRVIRSDGTLGGFSAPGGTKTKKKLLKKEGFSL